MHSKAWFQNSSETESYHPTQVFRSWPIRFSFSPKPGIPLSSPLNPMLLPYMNPKHPKSNQILKFSISRRSLYLRNNDRNKPIYHFTTVTSANTQRRSDFCPSSYQNRVPKPCSWIQTRELQRKIRFDHRTLKRTRKSTSKLTIWTERAGMQPRVWKSARLSTLLPKNEGLASKVDGGGAVRAISPSCTRRAGSSGLGRNLGFLNGFEREGYNGRKERDLERERERRICGFCGRT